MPPAKEAFALYSNSHVLMASGAELRAWLSSPLFRPRPSQRWQCLWPLSALLILFHSFTRSFMVAVFVYLSINLWLLHLHSWMIQSRLHGQGTWKLKVAIPNSDTWSRPWEQQSFCMRSTRIGVQVTARRRDSKGRKGGLRDNKTKRPGAETRWGADTAPYGALASSPTLTLGVRLDVNHDTTILPI